MLNDAGVGTEMMRVMSDDVESLCLVKECWELEEGFGTSTEWSSKCGSQGCIEGNKEDRQRKDAGGVH